MIVVQKRSYMNRVNSGNVFMPDLLVKTWKSYLGLLPWYKILEKISECILNMNFMNFAGNSNLELNLKIKKNILRVNLGIKRAQKNPGIHRNYDFWNKKAYLNFNIKTSKFTELTLYMKQNRSLGWISGIFWFLNQANETWTWIAQMVELQKSFAMIPSSNQFPGNWSLKIHFLTFAWVFEWVGGHPRANLWPR